jgi:hypothetical protein
MTDCPRRDKWIRPCRFEERYDVGPVEFPPDVDKIKISVLGLDAFRRKTYVGDVCTTCGRIAHLERQP